MNPLDGRYPARPGVAQSQRRLAKTDDVLARRISALKPADVGGGGPIGMAEVRAASSSIITDGQKIKYDGVSYGAPTDPLAGSAGASKVPVSDWCSLDSYAVVLAPGWYDITVSCEVGWADPTHSPASFYPLIFTDSSVIQWANTEPAYYPAVQRDPSFVPNKGFSAHMAYGPSFYDASVHFELRWSAYTGSGDALTGIYEPSPYIVWTIRKLT